MGIVYSVKSDYENAVKYFTKSLEINEFQSHARFRRAVALSKIGENEKALEDISAAEAMGLKDEDLTILKNKIIKKMGIGM